jgi:hypothetical protein
MMKTLAVVANIALLSVLIFCVMAVYKIKHNEGTLRGIEQQLAQLKEQNIDCDKRLEETILKVKKVVLDVSHAVKDNGGAVPIREYERMLKMGGVMNDVCSQPCHEI